MSRFIAVLDACVLYKAPVRDLFLRLGVADVFRPKWTREIHNEWMSNLVEHRGFERSKLERTRELMDSNLPDALVEGYENILQHDLPDSGDTHVLAAAIRCNADLIVTENIKDFPEEVVSKYDIGVEHHDEFALNMLTLQGPIFLSAVKEQRAELKNPPYEVGAFLDCFTRCGLVNTASELQRYSANI